MLDDAAEMKDVRSIRYAVEHAHCTISQQMAVLGQGDTDLTEQYSRSHTLATQTNEHKQNKQTCLKTWVVKCGPVTKPN